MNKYLSELGFRMPAEWEKQRSVWIVWPYNRNDWPGLFEYIPKTVSKIVSVISKTQKVNLIIKIKKDKKYIKKKLIENKYKKANVKFHVIPTDRIWIRDSGPIFLKNIKNNKRIFLNFKFNGWSKYKNYNKDDKINNFISKITKIKKVDPKIKIKNKIKRIVLEGGSIDVNGKGSILLTKECLLSKTQERNPGMKKKQYEDILYKYLNVSNFIWLNKGIIGDDTHGHIDDISRFISKNTIMTAVATNKKNPNYKILNENLKILKNAKSELGRKFNIIKVPMPRQIFINNTIVPASYMNFFITNKIVLLPVFNDKNDLKVISIFKKNFKKRKIVTINCERLIWGFGAIHCMTQQEPAS